MSGNFDWAKGWVGACAANGIVSGRGDGIYDPAATVTAVEAASMMMRALGYFRYQNDYADGFMVSTVRQGTRIGIFEGVGTDGSTPMTRNQVAQMALNALRSEMVDFTGTLGVELNGVKVNYRAEYTSRTSTEPSPKSSTPNPAWETASRFCTSAPYRSLGSDTRIEARSSCRGISPSA